MDLAGGEKGGKGMLRFIGRRLAQSVAVVFIVATFTFFLINLAPGGPSVVTRMDATQAERQVLLERYGLDKPVVTRYGQWMARALNGDLGTSLSSSQPVARRIAERFPHTLLLASVTLVLSVAGGVFLGVWAAWRRNSWVDYLAGFLSVIGLSLPAFWLGIMLILLFSVNLHWLPASGVASSGGGGFADRLSHLLLPALVLSTSTLPNIVRFTRSAMVEVIAQDYMRTARAKGVGGFRLIAGHALRNALIPVVTMIGVLVPRLMGGAVVTESVFGWPGLGQLIVEAANSRDYPLVMGVTVVVTAIVVLTNLMVDILYSRIDPRIRVS
jgi:peptide/nickel transport system permease protein